MFGRNFALRDRKYPVQYLLADDEGHGFARPVNNLAMSAAAEKFLAEYLGGRYQESMTPDVTKRLSELTVDPATVVLARKPDMSAAPDADLSGGWTVVANASGQMIDIAVDLKQDGADLTGRTTSQMGNGTIDGGKVSGKTFTAILHADIQGQSVDFAMSGTIDGDKMTGTFSNPGFGQVPFTAAKNK